MYKVMRSFISTGSSNAVISTGHTIVDIGASANLEVVDTFCYLGDMLSVDGDADAAVDARIRIGWCKDLTVLVFFIPTHYITTVAPFVHLCDTKLDV